ncbi:MAG: bifunctional folylpolyglutamate synthase/dihydrofolate synthase [Agathobacter sp.]|nr:bifunctional folylpolyglutamate synthase/dihydrofolate synthase [Agathobacter sp.]
MLTFKEAQEFVEETKTRGSVLGLTNMRALMDELGNPQNQIPTIHIAGTNGKGSFGAYLASICKEAGFKVGRYCSPAVFSPLECWQYDGRNITKEEYAECMSQVKNACDIIALRTNNEILPTSFEIETALAFVFMAKRKPDVFLLEVGMGGALDATNVVDNPLACVFTKISRDHMQFLGESLTEIATVKAGIMKPGAYIFWGEQESEVEKVLEDTFLRVEKEGNAIGVETVRGDVYSSRIQFTSQKPGELRFSYLGVNYMTRMSGMYQMQNAALAIAVFDTIWPILLLGQQDDMQMWQDNEVTLASWLDMEYASRVGVLNAVWPGRFEVIGYDPLFVIDGAHNEDAVKQLAITLEKSFTNQPVNFIIGILADKEHEKMLECMMPFANNIYTITPPNPRGLDGRVLAEEVKNWHENVWFCESIEDAVNTAISQSKQDGCPILAFGSLSYLGELKETYKQICESRKNDV